ncbi:MAG: hypothetical protein LPK09_00400, partial [Hymenobacteraceae bacterium]|nr:hypothetical protein [Hymenobacteraceae bacterium]
MDDVTVIGGCSKQLRAPATFLEGSIRWEDISGRGYEKFLSDVTSATPTVTPDETAPEYVDYRVNGLVRPSECATNSSHYDEVRVYFLPKPVVSIGPDPAIICPGGSTTMLTGSVTGGDGEFDYFWYDPSNTLVGTNLTYNAVTVGAHKFVVVPKNSTNCQEFSATVNVVTNLTANAGADQLACASGTVQLAGTVTAALGGRWSTSGSGTFSDANNL